MPLLRSFFYGAPIVVLVALMLVGIRGFDTSLGICLPKSLAVPGTVLAMLGIFIGLASVGIFGTVGEGTPLIVDPPKHLVVGGPYRYIRNPIYVSQLRILVGIGLSFRSPSILLFGLVWFVFVYLLVIRWEEPELKRKFGAEYERYCAQVPRWLPRLRRRVKPSSPS